MDHIPEEPKLSSIQALPVNLKQKVFRLLYIICDTVGHGKKNPTPHVASQRLTLL